MVPTTNLHCRTGLRVNWKGEIMGDKRDDNLAQGES